MTKARAIFLTLLALLLLAIAFPLIARTRTASRRTTCLANLHELGNALQHYTADAHAPLFHPLEEPFTHQNFWTEPLARYSANFAKLLQCPEASDPNPFPFTPGTTITPWNQPDHAHNDQPQSGAYTFNGWLYEARFSSAIYLGDEGDFLASELRTDDVPPLPTIIDPASFHRLPPERPAATIPAFADATWSETFPAPSDPIPTNTSPPSDITFHLAQLLIPRHGTAPTATPATNLAYLDGHAETTPLSALPTLPWQAEWVWLLRR